MIIPGHRLTLDPMGKCSSAFFSETTNQTETRQECALDGPLQSLGFLFRYKMEDGYYLQWWPSWISDRHKKPKF
jgi:hypothetical protein